MKKLRSLPYLVIFLLNLLIGFLGGSQVLPERTGKAYPIFVQTAGMDSPIPALANGQRSILLITVDKLEARKPRLTGVWAILYVPTNPRVTLLPIYPALNQKETGEELANSFRIQQSAGSPSLDPAFISLIQEQIPWWSGYILVDQTALAEVVDLWVYPPGLGRNISPSNAGSRSADHSGSQLVSDIPKVWEDPYSALFSQASLYQELCWGVAWAGAGLDASQTQEALAGIRKHFSTDLDPEIFVKEIQNLREQGGSLVCEFPTLSVQARIVK
jgi:hypothetical protein